MDKQDLDWIFKLDRFLITKGCIGDGLLQVKLI